MCLKFVKLREFYEIFKIRKDSYKFILSHHYSTVIAKFSNSQSISYSWEQFPVEWEQWAVEDCDSDTGEDSEAAGDS